jgi:hypothetical protein
VCLKVVKNEKEYIDQSLDEVKVHLLMQAVCDDLDTVDKSNSKRVGK